MLAIILTIILSLMISFMFTLDSSSVSLRFRETTISGIPLFYVVFAALIIGALLASVTTIVNLITSKLTIMGKNSDLKKSYKTTDELEAKVNKLEGEKLVLKEEIRELAHPRRFSA